MPVYMVSCCLTWSCQAASNGCNREAHRLMGLIGAATLAALPGAVLEEGPAAPVGRMLRGLTNG